MLVGCFAALRMLAIRGVSARAAGDTWEYERTSRRPWVVPVLYGWVHGNGRMVAQAAVGVVAWSVLALVIALEIESATVRRATVGAVLLFGLTPSVTRWDSMMLSESLAVSLTVLVVAVWVRWLSRPSLLAGVGVVAVMVLWTFVRHDNLWIEWALALVAVVVACRRLRWVPVALALLLLGGWGQRAYTQNTELAEFNVAESIAAHVIPDVERTAWFTDEGMPLPSTATPGEAVLPAPGRAPANVLRYSRASFYRWVRDDGMDTYARYLIAHPGYALSAPVGDLRVMLEPPDSYGDTASAVPSFVDGWLVDSTDSLAIALSLAVGLLGMRWAWSGFDRRWIVPLIVVALGVVSLWAIWHSVPGEKARHGVTVAVTLRVAVVMLIGLAVDRPDAKKSPAFRPGTPTSAVTSWFHSARGSESRT